MNKVIGIICAILAVICFVGGVGAAVLGVIVFTIYAIIDLIHMCSGQAEVTFMNVLWVAIMYVFREAMAILLLAVSWSVGMFFTVAAASALNKANKI